MHVRVCSAAKKKENYKIARSMRKSESSSHAHHHHGADDKMPVTAWCLVLSALVTGIVVVASTASSVQSLQSGVITRETLVSGGRVDNDIRKLETGVNDSPTTPGPPPSRATSLAYDSGTDGVAAVVPQRAPDGTPPTNYPPPTPPPQQSAGPVPAVLNPPLTPLQRFRTPRP